METAFPRSEIFPPSSMHKGNCTIKKYYLQQHLAEHKTKRGFTFNAKIIRKAVV